MILILAYSSLRSTELEEHRLVLWQDVREVFEAPFQIPTVSQSCPLLFPPFSPLNPSLVLHYSNSLFQI